MDVHEMGCILRPSTPALRFRRRTMGNTTSRLPQLVVRTTLITAIGAASAGCSSSDSSPTPVDNGVPDATTDQPGVYYGPKPVDSGLPDATTDEPGVYYGPVPVDSGVPDATTDEPMTYYGPQPVDAGVPDATDDEPKTYYGPDPVDAGSD